MPYMKSLATCLNRMVHEGYTDDFRVTEQGLESINSEHIYSPDQVEVVNFFRFEGQSDPGDNAILYVIRTRDGSMGTLVDAYGAYDDARVSRFMHEVTHIQKKTVKH